MFVPKVAVLLATYDGAAHCEAQLASILWQAGVEVHVYVRDDGSRDATPRILRKWAAQDPNRITVIDNGGVYTGSATGNFFELLAAIDPAHHDYVAFADQDDVWTPDKLARAVSQLQAACGEGYSSDLIAYNAASNAAWVVHKAGQPAELDYLFQGGSAGCTYVLSRRLVELAVEVMAEAPPYCKGASHDWILYAIARSRGFRWVHDRTAEILYRQHATNQYGAKRGLADLIGKAWLTRTRWYREHILWLRHVIVGSAEELLVLSAIRKGRIADRWWLIRHARRFRRTQMMVLMLRLAIIGRLI